MSIRRAKTTASPTLILNSWTPQDHDSDNDSDDSSKARVSWTRTWKRTACVALACLATAAILSVKLILPHRSLSRLTSTPSSIHIRKVLTESQQQCTVWIAPSSLKGVDGYGTFTTRDLQPYERILPSHDGLGVPIESYYYSSETTPFAKERNDWIRVWKNYWWARYVEMRWTVCTSTCVVHGGDERPGQRFSIHS